MKLYFSPGACSMSPHIVLRELGLPFELVKVDLSAKKTAAGEDFKAINPKGYVPALQLDNGDVLTEGPVIIQYLADLSPQGELAPANGTFARYRLQETLNFLSTEIHKTFSPLFNPKLDDDAKAGFKAKLGQRFGEIDGILEKQEYIAGDSFSVADAYLFTLLSWTRYFAIDLNQWPAIARYVERVGARPAVAQAVDEEAKAKKAA